MFFHIIYQKINSTTKTTIINNQSSYLSNSYLNNECLLKLTPLPLICIFGSITNILSIIVFSNKKMKDVSFKYMLAASFGDLIYLLLLTYNYTVFCPNFINTHKFGQQIYIIIVKQYLTSCLAIFTILIDLILSIQRYFILSNDKRSYLFKPYKCIILIVFIISFIFYMPVLFQNNILAKINSESDNIVEYSLIETEFGKSSMGNYLLIILSLIRIFLGIILLSFINLINAIIFRKRFENRLKSKIRLTNTNTTTTTTEITLLKSESVNKIQNSKEFKETKANRKITQMIMFTCLLYFFGHLPASIIFIMRLFLQPTPIMLVVIQFFFAFICLSKGLTFFIYYFYNNVFRGVLKQLFKNIFQFRKKFIQFNLLK
jgi:hypothetical protein